MFQIAFDPIFGSYTIVFLCAIILCVIVWKSRPTSDQLPHWGRRLLILLRGFALILLIFGMLRPALVHTVSLRLSAVVNILLDQTQSMNRNDEIGETSRFNAAKDSLRQAAGQLRQLQRQTDVKAFAFDTALSPLELTGGDFTNLPDLPKGQETPIGFTLDTIRERSAGKRVLATIMLTDGAQRTRPSRDVLPQDAAQRLRDAGIPLYTVPLGQSNLGTSIRDISLETLQANDRVFVKNTLIVSGTLRASGFTEQTIPVHLLFEAKGGIQEVVAQTTVQAKGEGQSVPFRLTYAPPDIGLFKYTVRIPPQEKEILDRNNEQSNFVQVLEGGLRVLFIQGHRNFEQRPLRQSLNASPDINVHYLRVDKPDGSLGAALQEPSPYNVFMISDVPAAMFTKEELQTMTNQIKSGAGFIMLGGLFAFAAGGYADTPLAQVSPIELRRADSQPIDGPIREDLHWPADPPIPMILTEQGKRHYVMRFDADSTTNIKRWAELPPLLGANRFDRLKPSAVPLAIGPNRQILLAMQMFGLGRVLAFAGDSTYRWCLAQHDEEHKTFWRQIVLWLAKMEGEGSGSCWITLENNRLFPGDTAKFQVLMRSEEGEFLRDFPAKVSVLKSDNTTETVTLVYEDGVPTGSFRSTEFSGDYQIQAAVEYKGETKQAEARFLVQDRNLELDNPVPYPTLLGDIAAITGGERIPPEQLGKLLENLIQKSDELMEQRETKKTLFDTWFFLLTFLSILAIEWFLRKYWGLV